MNPNRLILAGLRQLLSSRRWVAAVPGSAATIDQARVLGDVVNISAPATTKRALSAIKCQAPTDLSGGRAPLSERQYFLKLSKVKVSPRCVQLKEESGVNGERV